ncbi:MAG: 6-phosphogluconolactonase [Bacteroidetes bacterium]|jgi:6-phosphogluconolactonase|nr:6-phosphogluconolactonase [Bacteroidota bacterium]
MNYQLHIYENAENTARAVAELIKELARAKEAESKQLNIAVSGGSTPRQLFTLLGEEYENSIPWATIRFFWVDERCVEPTHPESNFGMTYDTLLQHPFVPAANVFRMKGEDIPENEAERYQKLLWKELPASDGFPVFDLILLGMGDDGHTASIFPNDMSLLASEFSVGVGVHPVSGQKRITLTGRTINNAGKVIFLITGQSKAAVIEQIINHTEDAKKYPAAHVGSKSEVVAFYLDKAAAGK